MEHEMIIKIISERWEYGNWNCFIKYMNKVIINKISHE